MKKIVFTIGTFFLMVSTIYSQTINAWSLEKCIDYAYTQNITIRKSELAIVRVNLMQVMELPVNDDFEIVQPDLDENINQHRIPDVKEVLETALSIEPQIKNAEVNKQIAALDEDIARSGYYPVLSASADLGSSYSSYSGVTQDTHAPLTQNRLAFKLCF